MIPKEFMKELHEKMEEVKKKRTQNAVNIKYLIEEKVELEDKIRIGQDAIDKLVIVEKTLQECMCNYLGCKNELS